MKVRLKIDHPMSLEEIFSGPFILEEYFDIVEGDIIAEATLGQVSSQCLADELDRRRAKGLDRKDDLDD